MVKDGWIGMIGAFLFIENMRKEHNFKLIHMKQFPNMKQQNIRIVLDVCQLMQDFIPFICYPCFQVFPLQTHIFRCVFLHLKFSYQSILLLPNYFSKKYAHHFIYSNSKNQRQIKYAALELGDRQCREFFPISCDVQLLIQFLLYMILLKSAIYKTTFNYFKTMSYVKEELDLLTQTRQGKSTEQPFNQGGKHKEVKNKPAIFPGPRGEMDLLCRFRYGTGKDLFTHPHPQKQERKKGPVQSMVGPKEGEKFEVKAPKGTRDFHPHQMAIRRKVIDSVVEVFKKHGGVEIDTPVFELKEVLTGKYGEDSKLIYDLEDQGGQKCSLRYDLTVPFARFMANNTNIQKIKRFHIGKVYRRDQPTITKGRYREFYQCDFDIAGKYDPMIPDAEVLSVMQQILETLGIQDFLVKVNHRKILQSLVAEAGCDPKMFKSICSSIDKLDKLSWEEVKEELIKTKGVSQQSADIIGNLTKHKGNPHQLLKFIMKGNLFEKQLDALQPVLQQMEKLFDYLEALEKNSKVSFDMSLARGLDYYTGLIYQIVLTDKKNELGSISGGGRYDNLIGMFCQYEIPSVGGSIGIQRLFTILEKKYMDKVKQNACEVLVATIGKIPVTQKLKVLNQLWKANIKAETMYIEKGKPDKQINHAFNNGIPLIIWIGETELQNGEANLKVLYKHEEMKVKLKNIGEELIPHVEMFRKEFELGNVELKNPKKK